MKVFHIATENFAGVPYSLVRAERLVGLDSHLITLSPPVRGHPQEEHIKLPFFRGFLPGFLRTLTKSTKPMGTTRYKGEERPPKWNPTSWGKLLFGLRDKLWEPILRRAGFPGRLDAYDIVVLDGGVGLLRSGKFVLDWASKHGKLVIIYYGDDLRRRGALPELENAAKLIYTFEFDHTLIHPRAKFLFYPFFSDDMPVRSKVAGEIRIGHSPTLRASKGTELIIRTVEKLERRYKNLKLILIEKMSYRDALRLKATVDIFIDQITELGYGISSLEALAMGIPVVVKLLPDFEQFLGEHPFVKADEKTLEIVLERLIIDDVFRDKCGKHGYEWVRKVHSPLRAAQTIVNDMRRLGWL